MSLNKPSRRKSIKNGRKANRAARNQAFQKQLCERKRLRRQRAAQHAAQHARFTYSREYLETQQVGPLRDIARGLELTPGRVRRADLIDAIIAKAGG